MNEEELTRVNKTMDNILSNDKTNVKLLDFRKLPEFVDTYKAMTGVEQDSKVAESYKQQIIDEIGERLYNDLINEQKEKLNNSLLYGEENIDLNDSVMRTVSLPYSTNVSDKFKTILEDEDLYNVYSELKNLLNTTYRDSPLDIRRTGNKRSFLHINASEVSNNKNIFKSIGYSFKAAYNDVRDTLKLHANNVTKTIDEKKVSPAGTKYSRAELRKIGNEKFNFIQALSRTDKYKTDTEITHTTLLKELNPNLREELLSEINNGVDENATIDDYLLYYGIYQMAEQDTFDLLVTASHHANQLAQYIGRYSSISNAGLISNFMENLSDEEIEYKHVADSSLKHIKEQYDSWYRQSILNIPNKVELEKIKDIIRHSTGIQDIDTALKQFAINTSNKHLKGILLTKENKLILRELKKSVSNYIEKMGVSREEVAKTILEKISNNEELTDEEKDIMALSKVVESFIKVTTTNSLLYGFMAYSRYAFLGFNVIGSSMNVFEGIIAETLNSYDDSSKIMDNMKAIRTALGMIGSKVPGVKSMLKESKKLSIFMHKHNITQDAANIIQRAGVENPSLSSKWSQPLYGYHAGETVNQSITVYKMLQKYGINKDGKFISYWDLLDNNCELKEEYKDNEDAQRLVNAFTSTEHQHVKNVINQEIQNNHGNYFDTRRTISNEKVVHKAFTFLRRWMGSYIANYYGGERRDILQGKIKKGFLHQPASISTAFNLGTSFLFYSNPITALSIGIAGTLTNQFLSKVVLHQKAKLNTKSSLNAFIDTYLTTIKMVVNDLTLHKIHPLKKNIGQSFDKYVNDKSYKQIDAGNARKMARHMAYMTELTILIAALKAMGKAMDDDDDDDDVPLSWATNILSRIQQQLIMFTNPISLAQNLFQYGIFNTMYGMQEGVIKFITDTLTNKKSKSKLYKNKSKALVELSYYIPEPMKSIYMYLFLDLPPLLGFQKINGIEQPQMKKTTGYKIGNSLYRTDNDMVGDYKQKTLEMYKENDRFKDIPENKVKSIINDLYDVNVLKDFKSHSINSVQIKYNNLPFNEKKELYKSWTGKELTDNKEFKNAVKDKINDYKNINYSDYKKMMDFFISMENDVGAFNTKKDYIKGFTKKKGKLHNIYNNIDEEYKKVTTDPKYENTAYKSQIEFVKQIKDQVGQEFFEEHYKVFNEQLNNMTSYYKEKTDKDSK